ncbi:MAG: hypothetical protein HC854_12475 [Flavobacterium sp.]|nr:hypothetical protein [Flavobacterium sp.]
MNETKMDSSNSNEVFEKSAILIEKASQYIGTRYRSGGTTENGFDCSGLMCTTFKEINLQLPRTSSDQANFGNTISKNEAQKGDLIFLQQEEEIE